jgi:hypothetical protein
MHAVHARTGLCMGPTPSVMALSREQAALAHTESPQLLQWWRRLNIVKGLEQWAHSESQAHTAAVALPTCDATLSWRNTRACSDCREVCSPCNDSNVLIAAE